MNNRITIKIDDDNQLGVRFYRDARTLKFSPEVTKAVLGFARVFRDRELGRWRDPENPDWVVYRDKSREDHNGRCIVAVNEKTAVRYRLWENWELLHPAAQNYFKDHPAWSELPTSVGAIIQGNGVRMHLVGRGGGRDAWFDPTDDNFKTDDQVVEIVGPGWRVIHEGMKEDDG